ncbi:Metalloendopeptidase [Aphelenchoides besseyi]|nr:Metalloendopeptidase [Aphelenchoides besseyi]
MKLLTCSLLFLGLVGAIATEDETIEIGPRKKCRFELSDQQQLKISGARTFSPNDVEFDEERYSERTANQDVYLWPSLSEREREVIKDAFYQIARRTCIKYHADRWESDRPYVVIRKSKKFSGYTDNKVEDVAQRSILYLTEKALNEPNFNNSRGMIMDQLLRFMGYHEEYLRPDAISYIQPVGQVKTKRKPNFSPEQLNFPFDPESITVPAAARNWFDMTIYCPARKKSEIGAGQRTGLLTRWDAVKLNSMYCPDRVGYADLRKGPCVVPRKRAD